MSNRDPKKPLVKKIDPPVRPVIDHTQARIDTRRWEFNRIFYLKLQGKSIFNSY